MISLAFTVSKEKEKSMGNRKDREEKEQEGEIIRYH